MWRFRAGQGHIKADSKTSPTSEQKLLKPDTHRKQWAVQYCTHVCPRVKKPCINICSVLSLGWGKEEDDGLYILLGKACERVRTKKKAFIAARAKAKKADCDLVLVI